MKNTRAKKLNLVQRGKKFRGQLYTWVDWEEEEEAKSGRENPVDVSFASSHYA
jgi:hypothetical protein